MKFPEDAKLSNEARDLICRLLCDVDHRIGSSGADQIKVVSVTGKKLFNLLFLSSLLCFLLCLLNVIPLQLGTSLVPRSCVG